MKRENIHIESCNYLPSTMAKVIRMRTSGGLAEISV
jgi:hypothetical protein